MRRGALPTRFGASSRSAIAVGYALSDRRDEPTWSPRGIRAARPIDGTRAGHHFVTRALLSAFADRIDALLIAHAAAGLAPASCRLPVADAGDQSWYMR